MAEAVVAAVALLFAVASFWWIQLRPAALSVTRPRSFGVLRTSEGLIAIALPLVFANTGALPIVVRNLRLLMDEAGGEFAPFVFNSIAEKLASDSERGLATPFPVLGRDAVTLICEFTRDPANLQFKAATYTAQVQVLAGVSAEWRTLCSFPLVMAAKAVTSANQPGYIGVDSELGAQSLASRRWTPRR